MLADGYEPRFDREYAFGHQGEIMFDNLIDGLKAGQLRAEIKTKSLRDSMLFVEVEHDPGRTGRYSPSGLSVTQAEVWIYVVENTAVCYIIPVGRLQRLANIRGLALVAGGGSGSCPTRGFLVHLDVVTSRRCDP